MIENSKTVVIRADGNGTIGMGHIMRCIGLAQELRRNDYNIVFAVSSLEQAVVKRLQFEGFKFCCLEVDIATPNDSAKTLALCHEERACLLVVDGYMFNAEWFQALKGHDHKLMLWTDFLQDKRLPVDIVFDQTPHADEKAYRLACPDGRILCGLEYAVLRSEFIENSSIRRPRKNINNVLVTMGGADPAGATLTVLSSLLKVSYPVDIRVVIGPATESREGIILLARQLDNCEIYESVKDMSSLLGWADIAISSAGISLWEFAYSGLPTIAMYIADNQKPLAEALQAFGGGINLGAIAQVAVDDIHAALSLVINDAARLDEMSHKMMSKVDGDGVKRLVASIGTELSAG